MLIYTPRPDDTILVQPNMSLKVKDIKFPKPEFITKNGYYFDNSTLKQIELPDGTIDFEFRSVCVKEGDKKNYYNILGQHHRLDGPAIESPDGSKYWFQNDKRHNPNGPATIHPDGTQEWFQNGQLHRIDGPAFMWLDGTEHWYQNGKCHRLDGPAIIRIDGTKEYWINGTQVTKEDLTC